MKVNEEAERLPPVGSLIQRVAELESTLRTACVALQGSAGLTLRRKEQIVNHINRILTRGSQ